MTIAQLILLLEAKLSNLNQQKLTAEQLGNVTRIIELDAEILETDESLHALRNL